jgi:hypothetical protein
VCSHCLGDLCSSLKQCCILEGNYEKKVQHTQRGERGEKKNRASRHRHTQKEKKKKTTSTQYRDLFQEEELNKSKRNRWKSQVCQKKEANVCMYVYVPLAMSVEGKSKVTKGAAVNTITLSDFLSKWCKAHVKA